MFFSRSLNYYPPVWNIESSPRSTIKTVTRKRGCDYLDKAVDWESNNDQLKLYFDLPGVKLEDVQVTIDSDKSSSTLLQVKAERKRPSGSSVTISREWDIEPAEFEVENVAVYLTDGVLTLAFPKKKPTRKKIQVSCDNPPHRDDSDVFSVALDVPGLHHKNIEVVCEKGLVQITGERKTGNSVCSVRRLFSLPERSIALESLQGYIADGVLTLRVDRIQSRGRLTRTIPVLSEEPAANGPPNKLQKLAIGDNQHGPNEESD